MQSHFFTIAWFSHIQIYICSHLFYQLFGEQHKRMGEFVQVYLPFSKKV